MQLVVEAAFGHYVGCCPEQTMSHLLEQVGAQEFGSQNPVFRDIEFSGVG